MAAAAAKSLQSCPTLCDPIDGSPLGSSVPGILQARILEWVAISFSNACMHAKLLQLCPTLCDPMDSSPPASSVHGILQARILWLCIILFYTHTRTHTHTHTFCYSVAKLYLTLCDSMDCSPPGSFVSSVISWSLLRFMPIDLVMLPNHLTLCSQFFQILFKYS